MCAFFCAAAARLQIMEKLWTARAGDATPEQRDVLDNALRQPQIQELWRVLRQQCGISNGFAACYFLSSLLDAEKQMIQDAGAIGHVPDDEEVQTPAPPVGEPEPELEDNPLQPPAPADVMLSIRETTTDEALMLAAKDKDGDVVQEEAADKEVQNVAVTATKRGGVVLAQAGFQVGMRATGNALATPLLGSAGAALATSSLMGIGVALVVKDVVKVVLGSSEGRLISTVRGIICTRYALALRGILLEELYPVADSNVE